MAGDTLQKVMEDYRDFKRTYQQQLMGAPPPDIDFPGVHRDLLGIGTRLEPLLHQRWSKDVRDGQMILAELITTLLGFDRKFNLLQATPSQSALALSGAALVHAHNFNNGKPDPKPSRSFEYVMFSNFKRAGTQRLAEAPHDPAMREAPSPLFLTLPGSRTNDFLLTMTDERFSTLSVASRLEAYFNLALEAGAHTREGFEKIGAHAIRKTKEIATAWHGTAPKLADLKLSKLLKQHDNRPFRFYRRAGRSILEHFNAGMECVFHPLTRPNKEVLRSTYILRRELRNDTKGAEARRHLAAAADGSPSHLSNS